MPAFNRAIITDKGLALNTKANNGECSIAFTKAASGSGTYDAGTDLSKLTALKEQKQSFSFNKKTKQNNRTVMLRTILTNEGLLEGYYINEFGIFATDPDEGEILYSIATAVSGQAEYMPVKATGAAPTTSTIESYVSVSNADSVTIEVSQGAYALQEDLDALEERVTAIETELDGIPEALAGKANKYKSQSVTVPAGGWVGDTAPYTNTLSVEGVTATNDISVIPRFTWTAAQAEAWAGAMILSGDQAAGSLTLKAYGDKPEIDIDITVMIGDEVEGGE